MKTNSDYTGNQPSHSCNSIKAGKNRRAWVNGQHNPHFTRQWPASVCPHPAHGGSSQTQLCSPANQRKHAKFLTPLPRSPPPKKSQWLIGITVSICYCFSLQQLVSECVFMTTAWHHSPFNMLISVVSVASGMLAVSQASCNDGDQLIIFLKKNEEM